MSHVFAYLRVSTDAQDVANQRHGVVRYCTDKQLLAPVFVEDTASGRTDWRARPLGAADYERGVIEFMIQIQILNLKRIFVIIKTLKGSWFSWYKSIKSFSLLKGIACS